MRSAILLYLLLLGAVLSSQVSISTTGNPPDPTSMLDITGTGKGVLIPRMMMAERNAIASPANALLVYQTDGIPGFYYNRGTPSTPEWVFLSGMPSGETDDDRIPIDSLPYTISMAGSYYVTAHLTGPVGITITTSNVTLDLNGYNLRGTPGNTSEGVEVTGTASNIIVRNGSITHWGREGIKAVTTSSSGFYSLQIINNALDGIVAGHACMLSGVIASGNGFDGIDLGESAVLHQCTASANLNDGIEADVGASFMQCTALDNMQNGFRATGAATITSCNAAENGNHGFSCGSGSTVTGNTATGNTMTGFYLFSACHASGNVSRTNGQHGFEWLNDCMLTDNLASLNTYSGFNTTYPGGKVDNNTSTSNAHHGFNIQSAGGCQITQNTASGNGISAFNVMAGNAFATVITSATINTNTNPFANFQL